MRSWEKFAWKKGNVLINGCGFMCIFKEWASDDYTKFNGCYSSSRDGYEDVQNADTMKFQKIDNNTAYGYIREIEKKLGGKFNLETLTIDKQPEFKDGDIVFEDCKDNRNNYISIHKNITNHKIYDYCSLDITNNELDCTEDSYVSLESYSLRLATDSEKQQLFDALAKKGKVWNSDTKQIEDLPKKCELKPMDWCLMRDHGEKWKLCQFGFFDKMDDFEAQYNAVGGNWYNECLPYNDSTKHLLGTTDERKGGE